MFIQELQLQSIRSRVTSNDQLRLDTNFQILVRKFLPFATIVSLAIFCFAPTNSSIIETLSGGGNFYFEHWAILSTGDSSSVLGQLYTGIRSSVCVIHPCTDV